MTPTHLSSTPASVPVEEHHKAQQDQGEFHCREQHQEEGKYASSDESSDQFLSSAHSTERSDGNCKQEHEVVMKDEDHRNGSVLSVKWMSSKMRLMKKMMNTEQTVSKKTTQTTSSTLDTYNSGNSSSCNIDVVRTCSDCNTTKTPLWRSGPRGPKTLCNACGIRQRKARRAMAAAQAEASDTVVASETSSTNGTKLQIKAKRCKLTARRNRKKLCFEDFAVSLSKNAAYHQVFPQDEKEAAILLMALSYGLAHG